MSSLINETVDKKVGIKFATIEPASKDQINKKNTITKPINYQKKSKSTDIRKFFGMSTLDNNKNIVIPVKPGKKIYERKKYDLGDGAIVTYIPNYVNNPDKLFTELKEKIDWGIWKFELHGKEVQSPRLISVIHFDTDDTNDFPELLKIKSRVEKITGLVFRYGVCNYYRSGDDAISPHSDRESPDGDTVVSVSVGATRKFVMKHKFRKGIRHVFMLAHGDVLILNDYAIKKVYTHAVPRMANVGERINITFRE